VTRRQLDGLPVTAEEYGFVVGGRVRAIEVAVADLLEGGALRIDRDGELSRTGVPCRTTSLQAEALRAIGDGMVPVAAVFDALGFGPPLLQLDDRVRSRRLAPPRDLVPRTRNARIGRNHDQLVQAGMLSATMLGTAGGRVAVGGVKAYPDDEIAAALESGRGPYSAIGNSCSGGGGCGAW
jgi:uncharacterized protein (TIGR04222 family)